MTPTPIRPEDTTNKTVDLKKRLLGFLDHSGPPDDTQLLGW